METLMETFTPIILALAGISAILIFLVNLNVEKFNDWLNSHKGCSGACNQGRTECNKECPHHPDYIDSIF